MNNTGYSYILLGVIFVFVFLKYTILFCAYYVETVASDEKQEMEFSETDNKDV